MNKPIILYIDQLGGRIYARSVKELRVACGGGRVSKIYRDKKDGSAVHCGYAIGERWFRMYQPIERPV